MIKVSGNCNRPKLVPRLNSFPFPLLRLDILTSFDAGYNFDEDDDANSDDDQLEEERFSMLPPQKLFRPLGWWVAGDITTVSVGLSRPPLSHLGTPLGPHHYTDTHRLCYNRRI